MASGSGVKSTASLSSNNRPPKLDGVFNSSPLSNLKMP